jgi:hypothetical protein
MTFVPRFLSAGIDTEQKADESECNVREFRKPLVHETVRHDRKTGGTDGETAQHQQGDARQERRPPHDVGDEADQEKQAEDEGYRHPALLP